ncbi:MAG: hypothetical protein WC955_08865, partial [Elusimicrobiota bacterium]
MHRNNWQSLYSILLLTLSLGLLSIAGLSAGNIRLGEEVRLRGVYIINPDFDTAVLDDVEYTSQRVRGYLESEIVGNLTIRVQLQSLSVWGSTQPMSISFVYPHTNSQVWVEHAYFEWKDFFNIWNL